MKWIVLALACFGCGLFAVEARADAVPPPPLDCVAGSYGETCHGGPHCRPRSCTDDAECEAGESCQPLPLCIAQIDCGGQGGPFLVDEVKGACPNGSCAEGSCQSVRVCADGTPTTTGSTSSGTTTDTSGSGPGTTNGGAGGGSSGDTRVDQGCGCRVVGANAALGARHGWWALAALGLIRVRRRDRR